MDIALNRFHIMPFDQRSHEFVDGNANTGGGMPSANMDACFDPLDVKNVFLATVRGFSVHSFSP